MSVLITGGAGYIGSNCAVEIAKHDCDIIIVDNLSKTKVLPKALEKFQFHQFSIGEKEKMNSLFLNNKIEHIIHLAAYIDVAESERQPRMYYENNVLELINLLDVACKYDLKSFVFSSSAAVYGPPINSESIKESHPVNPCNTYGNTKLCGEKIIQDYSKTFDFHYCNLRYFNVAGANLIHNLGQFGFDKTSLIKVACEVATNKRKSLQIFGTDYPTKDGTGVRDYIHISDLANIHYKSLEYINQYKKSTTFNCGYGSGFSVNEVINTIKALSQKEFNIINSTRRPGDAAEVIADTSALQKELNWQAQFNDLKLICKSSLDFEAMN